MLTACAQEEKMMLMHVEKTKGGRQEISLKNPWENGFCGVFNHGGEGGGAYEMRKFVCLPVGFICFLKFTLKREGKIE